LAPLGSGAVEMTERWRSTWRSTEASGGALMERWFQTRGGEIGAGVCVVENGGALVAFYSVGQWKADDQGEGGDDGETLMTPVTGDVNREGETMRCDHF
jgi:hypothetical protein